MSYKRIPYDSQEEWLQLRTKGIGGSDSASIIGLNPYMTNLQLWNYKTNKVKRENVDNFFTNYGHKVEDPVRSIFATDYLNKLLVYHTDELLVSDEKEYLRASLDGEIEVLEDTEITSFWKPHFNKTNEEEPESIVLKKGWKGIYEGKTAFVVTSLHKEKWDNRIPQNYFCQLLHYMIVKDDTDFCVLSVMLNHTDTNNVKTHEIRNYVCLKSDVLDSLNYLKNAEIDFWENNVVANREPNLIIRS